MSRTQSAEILLGGSAGTLIRWVSGKHAVPGTAAGRFLEAPSVSTARVLVSSLDDIVHVYATTVEELIPGKQDLLEGILHLELGSIASGGWIGVTQSIGEDFSLALAAKTREWLKDLQAGGVVPISVSITDLHPTNGKHDLQISADALTYVALAGLDKWTSEQRDRTYREKLSQIQSLLGLKPSELAAVLHVSREAVRQWFDGAQISNERWPDIDRLVRVSDFLLRHFKPEVLPSLIRRRPPILGNRRPLDLLVSGRDDELISAYDQLFAPGVTQ